jgi:hypothetical protein
MVGDDDSGLGHRKCSCEGHRSPYGSVSELGVSSPIQLKFAKNTEGE